MALATQTLMTLKIYSLAVIVMLNHLHLTSSLDLTAAWYSNHLLMVVERLLVLASLAQSYANMFAQVARKGQTV